MSVEQEVSDLLANRHLGEAILVVARAVDRLLQPQVEADRLQGLAQEGFDQARKGG